MSVHSNSKKQRARGTLGRLSLPEERRDWRRVLLLANYESNKNFWVDWYLLLYDYERLLEGLIRSPRRSSNLAQHADESLAWKALLYVIEGYSVPYRCSGSAGKDKLRLSRNTHLRHYRRQLIELTEKWGLRCEWAHAWIHASFLEWIQIIAPREYVEAHLDRLPPGLRRTLEKDLPRMPTEKDLRGRLRKAFQAGTPPEGSSSLVRRATHSSLRELGAETALERRWQAKARLRLRYVRQFANASEPSALITIEVPYDLWPRDNWPKVEREILRRARAQRDRSRQAICEAGFEHWDHEPQTKEHLQWLYQRICPAGNSERYPTPWSKIAKGADVSVNAVTWAVKKLAGEMEIELPKAPPGRPRKFEQ